MAAVWKAEAGTEPCRCSFLLLDMTLAQEWLTSFKQFVEAAKNSFKGVSAKKLLMPWTLGTLAEHEDCFQRWCILQFLVGVITTFVTFVLFAIWCATESPLGVSFGSIVINSLMKLAMAFIATWIMWFGVITKQGCCCAVACCCLGKPNILVASIVAAIFVLSSLRSIIQAFVFGHVLVVLAALVALVHLVTQIYMALAAFLVWLNHRGQPPAADMEADVAADAPPTILGQRGPALGKEGLPTTADEVGTKDATVDGQKHAEGQV